MSMPVILPKPNPAVQPRAQVRRYVVGMDGIRRPVPLTPREVLANMAAPEPVMAAEMSAPAMMAVSAEMPTPWRMPSLRLPEIEWRRPAAAFALVALAFTAAFGARMLVMPRSTANAEAAQSVAPAPTPAAKAVAPAKDTAQLQKIIDNFAAATPDKWGIVVKDLSTGQTASYHADRQIMSASLYKLFVAQRIYQRIDLGQLDYDVPAGGGSGRNIDGCLTIMINISDNTCGQALGDILGWGAQNQALQVEGYKQTDLATPQQTSAADVALLLNRLYDGTLLSPDSTTRFMNLLKDQRVNNRLPQGLPAGTVIAHKTGDLDGVMHDAGIVYGPKTNYLVVVTSGPWDLPGNEPPAFADLSHQLWDYFEQQ